MASTGGVDDHIVDDGPRDWSDLHTRRSSFHNFPSAEQVPPERLARAGFYYTCVSDRVCCFSCQNTIEGWQQGENPVDRHRKVSPECTFLKFAHRDNLPVRTSSCNPVSVYDEDAEAMEFRLRIGEVVDESVYPKIPHMKSEDARLMTFSNWPSRSPVWPVDLAQAGLFRVEEGDLQTDRVQCFCCGGLLSNWVEGDDPWQEHSRHFGNCFFILGHDVGNIPSEQPRQSGSAPISSFESFEGRLQSFSGREHPIDPERLARAGFYSTGDHDRVLCFKCEGGLKDWQPNEDPWEEHAKNYPGCSFLLAEKGQEFINSVQLRNAGCSASNGFASHEKSSNGMQSEFTRTAIGMGFDPIKVERTILEKIRRSSQGYSTLEDLIEDLTNASDSDVPQFTKNEEDNLKKLERLQQEKLCKVCMDRDTSIVFVPCGHLVTCKKCSDSLSKCPICCANITQKIKIYCS